MTKRLLIDDLLQKPVDVKIPVGEKEVTLWVRPSRDPERTMATAKARNASRSLRKILQDRKSEEYRELIGAELDGAEKNDLRKVWVNGKLIERAIRIRNQSLEDRDYVPSPLDNENAEGVMPKDMDEYEDEVDKVEAERELNVMQAISAAQRELEKEAEKIKDKDLQEAAIPQLIESLCSRAYEVEFVAQLILRCTFEDKKLTKKAFDDIEQVYALRDVPREKLTQAHTDAMLDQEAVKN